MLTTLPKFSSLEPLHQRIDFSYAEGAYIYEFIQKTGLQYEIDVCSLLLSFLGDNSRRCFINIGANISYFPLFLGSIFGDTCEIHSFEPMPALFEMGKKGLELNGLTANAKPHALSDFVGEAEFYLSAKTDASNSLNPTFRPSKSVITVPVSTIDHEFLEERQSPLINSMLSGERANDFCAILVIDTESTEPDVLKGASSFIERVKPIIICEVLAGRTEEHLHAIFSFHRYFFYRLTDDDLILEKSIFGDRTYQHRDWLFTPSAIDAELRIKYRQFLQEMSAPRTAP